MKWQLLADLPKNHKFNTRRAVVACYSSHHNNEWVERDVDPRKPAGYYITLGYTHYIAFGYPAPPQASVLYNKNRAYLDDMRRG